MTRLQIKVKIIRFILSAAKYLYKMAAWILRFTQNDKFARNKILLLVRE